MSRAPSSEMPPSTASAVLRVKELRERSAEREWAACRQRVQEIESRLQTLRQRYEWLNGRRSEAQTAVAEGAPSAGDWMAANRAEHTATLWLEKAEQQLQAVTEVLEQWKHHQVKCAQRWQAAQESTRMTRERLKKARLERQARLEVAEEEAEADERLTLRPPDGYGSRPPAVGEASP